MPTFELSLDAVSALFHLRGFLLTVLMCTVWKIYNKNYRCFSKYVSKRYNLFTFLFLYGIVSLIVQFSPFWYFRYFQMSNSRYSTADQSLPINPSIDPIKTSNSTIHVLFIINWFYWGSAMFYWTGSVLVSIFHFSLLACTKL